LCLKGSARLPVHDFCLIINLGCCAVAADVAESIGRELLVYGRRIPKAEMFARIDAVDADTVRAVADRFIYDQDLAIAAVGDTQFLPDYNWFRRRTYWIRY
jgi:processing peptidase subunit beta